MNKHDKQNINSQSALLLACVAVTIGGCAESAPDSRLDHRFAADLSRARYDAVTESCSPVTCSGCCSGDICIDHPSPAACGYGGIACQSCGRDQICMDGVCGDKKKCDASNCKAGCCDSQGECRSGASDSTCGTGGAACTACNSSAGQVCVAGKCGAKGSGRYRVTVVSCTIENTFWSGPCSMESYCDPYVILSVGDTTGQSSKKDGTNNPVWNDQLLNATEAEILKGFNIQVWDENWSINTEIAACSWRVTHADLMAGKIVQHCGGYPDDPSQTYVKDLTFTFQPM